MKKCKVMHVGLHNPGHNYSMNGSLLCTVNSEKDIGITISDNLKPSEHCRVASRTAMNVLFQLLRSFSYRDKKVFLKLFITYVRPHLEFASPVWNPWLVKDIRLLERVQEKFVRNVQGLRATEYRDRLVELGILSLEDRRLYLDLIETFKIIKGFNNVKCDEYFTLIRDSARPTTRSNDCQWNIIPLRCNSDIRRHFFINRVAVHWNNLPIEMKELTRLVQFKSDLKCFMLSTY